MSHTLRQLYGAITPVELVIIDYTNGGEVIPSDETIGIFIEGVIFATVPPNKNSLGVALFPVLINGSVRLFRFVSGSPVEIPTTPGLNATISALLV